MATYDIIIQNNLTSKFFMFNFSQRPGIVLEKKNYHDRNFIVTIFCIHEGICTGFVDKTRFQELHIGSLHQCSLTVSQQYSTGIWTLDEETSSFFSWMHHDRAYLVLKTLCQLCRLILKENTNYNNIFFVLEYLVQNTPPCQEPHELNLLYTTLEKKIIQSFYEHDGARDIYNAIYEKDYVNKNTISGQERIQHNEFLNQNLKSRQMILDWEEKTTEED